jgi:hypothetical protein
MEHRRDAQYMRKLIPGDISRKLDRMLEFIEYLAKHGEDKIWCNYAHPFDTELWVVSNGETEDWLYAKAKLEELGFTVTYVNNTSHYGNHPAATVVDKGTIISWKETRGGVETKHSK